jgi:hypothetical protein
MATKAIFYTCNNELAEKVEPYLKRIGVGTEVSPVGDVIRIIIPMREQDKEYLVGLIKNIVKNVGEDMKKG